MYFELKRLSLDNPGVLELYRQEWSLRALFREVSCLNDRITEGREDYLTHLLSLHGVAPRRTF